MNDTVSLRCCWGGDYGVFVNVTWRDLDQSRPGILCYGITNRNSKEWSENPTLWPWSSDLAIILKLNRILAAVEVHVRAKFHETKSTGSRIIVLTKQTKKLSDDAGNITVIATADSSQSVIHSARQTISLLVDRSRIHNRIRIAAKIESPSHCFYRWIL